MIGGDPSIAELRNLAFMTDYCIKFRTFKYGALHEFLPRLFLELSINGTNPLFENSRFKYTQVTDYLDRMFNNYRWNNFSLAINDPYKSSSQSPVRRPFIIKFFR